MPRPDVSEERKSQILQAAMQVVARKGYASARMDEIARESGLSVGILYWYFKGKLEITLALMDLFFAPDVEALKASIDSPEACREKLWALFMQDLVKESNSILLSLWVELYHQAAREPQVRERLLDYLAQYRDLTAQIVERGIDRGELRAGLDSQAVAYALQILFDGFMTNLTITQEANFYERFQKSFNLLWDGLKP